MSDPLEQVLRLVSEGRLTADEAEPILAALEATRSGESTSAPASSPDDRGDRPRFARIEVTEGGRTVINMRIPLNLGLSALSSIPGLTPDSAADIRAAFDSGTRGPILDVTDDGGDGTRIVLE
ncbi:MAG TPA: hypothetical protein VH813_02835 [Candidatus Limnocylindrales bacterium]|jgi:hypothetical protein